MITRPDFYAAIFVLIYAHGLITEKEGPILWVFISGAATAVAYGISWGLGHFIS